MRAIINDIKTYVPLSTGQGTVDINADGTPDGEYRANLLGFYNYYPYGMEQPGRCLNPDNYRYGFNGMEKDNEVKGGGNSYTTPFRQYDPRLGRWMTQDPIVKPFESPFMAFGANPIYYTDPSGLDPYKRAQRKARRMKTQGAEILTVERGKNRKDAIIRYIEKDGTPSQRYIESKWNEKISYRWNKFEARLAGASGGMRLRSEYGLRKDNRGPLVGASAGIEAEYGNSFIKYRESAVIEEWSGSSTTNEYIKGEVIFEGSAKEVAKLKDDFKTNPTDALKKAVSPVGEIKAAMTLYFDYAEGETTIIHKIDFNYISVQAAFNGGFHYIKFNVGKPKKLKKPSYDIKFQQKMMTHKGYNFSL